MLNFEYDVRLNDDERPYIHLPEYYEDKSEDKFMAVELTRYLLISVLKTEKIENENDVNAINTTLHVLESISEEFSLILKEQMENKGERMMNINTLFHVSVDDIKQRDELNYNGIVYEGKIFKRVEGLTVLVKENNKVYQLKGGIDNQHWTEV